MPLCEQSREILATATCQDTRSPEHLATRWLCKSRPEATAFKVGYDDEGVILIICAGATYRLSNLNDKHVGIPVLGQ